jgi:hypothetical protein
MGAMLETPPPIPTVRPPIVWVIAAYSIVANVFGWILIGLLFAAKRYIVETQYGFFYEIPAGFWIASAVVSLVQILGGLLIFGLRKLCVPFFALGLLGNIATSVYVLTQTKYLKVLGFEQLFTVIVSSLLPLGMIWYAMYLTRRGMMK